MYLRTFRAKNYRLLEDFEVSFHPAVTVFIGPNYAGKSTVFEALLFLKEALGKSLPDTALSRGGIKAIASRCDTSRTISLEIGLDEGASRGCGYSVEFDQQGILREKVASGNQTLIQGVRGQGSGASVMYKYPALINVHSVVSPSTNLLHFVGPNRPAMPPVKDFLASILNVDPFRNVNFQAAVGPKEMIAATGADLAQVLHYYHNSDHDKFDAYGTLVRRVLPEVKQIETPVPGSNTTSVQIKFLGSGAKHDLRSLSSGIKDVLVILAAAHFSAPETLILIEEPENHLHPAAQKALCALLQEIAKAEKKQLVLTTHSDFVLKQFKSEQCVFIDRHESGSKAAPLNTMDVNLACERLGIDTSTVLALLGRARQVIVIVEGQGDTKVVEALIREDSALATKVLTARADGGGWREIIREAAQLRDALKRFRIPSHVFVLLDNDGERNQKQGCLKEQRFNEQTSHVWSKKEIESYMILPGALARISGKTKEEVQEIITQAKASGKPCLNWVLEQLGIPRTPVDVILTNALRSSRDEVPPELLEVREKLSKIFHMKDEQAEQVDGCEPRQA